VSKPATRSVEFSHPVLAAMKARVHITLKQGVLDPQGKAIAHALGTLGFSGVDSVRQGKLIELEVAESDPGKARAQIDAMCKQLLANTVIEDYSIDLAK
jgi:phosphoribosylformylglycinamidine synthase subunit PurS